MKINPTKAGETANLYFHIPFCKRRCRYCAFYTVKWHNYLEADYVSALLAEMKGLSGRLGKYRVTSLYFGGGTPSLIQPELIAKLIKEAKSLFQIEPEAEITLEANPDSLSFERLKDYKQAGVNRLSLGLQAWQDEILQYFGRLHDRETFLKALGEARKAGFSNINVDLIFGIPGQTLTQWQKSLSAVMTLAPEHISCYSLELHNRSTLGVMRERGELKPLDEDSDRQMYHYAQKALKNAGYRQYEISNWAMPGFECRHNRDFWQQQPFWGFGAGASSFFDRKQSHQAEDVTAYLKNPQGKVVDRILSDEELSYDYVILHLRLTEGLSLSQYRQTFNRTFEEDYGKFLDHLREHGLIEVFAKQMRLTKRGMDLYDYVVEHLKD